MNIVFRGMKFLQNILLITFFSVCISSLWARPAYPGLHKITLADGSELMCRLVGDEHGHWFVSTDGRYFDRNDTGQWHQLSEADIEVRQQRMMESRKAIFGKRAQATNQRTSDEGAGRITDFPTKGNVRGLFLLVEFDDVKFQPESDSVRFTRQLNEEGFADDGATGSARDYFISQSYGLFTPTFDVVGPIHLPHNEGYYGANQMDADINPGQMVIDACQLAHDSLGVDFGNYDFDDDGIVDFVFILYAGYGENYGALPSTIWPHMSKLTDQRKYLTLDGKNFDLYACSCELRGTSGTAIDGIGAFCHEFGHVLGLPDIYDTFNSRNLQLGAWDIMDAGSYNNLSRTPSSYTGYERYCLGWLDMVDLTEPADSIILPEINESRVCYRIATRTGNEGEFFTLENHQQQGWDAYQPSSGMMIIHIDYEASIWHSNTVNSGMHPRVDLVEADGTPGAPTESDLFPTESNNSFTDYSNPNSLAWDKTPTERGVDHILQEADGTISFRFMRDRLFRPIAHEVTQLCDTSFVAEWDPVEGAIAYRIDLQEELPDSLNPILLEDDFALLEEGNYPMAGSSDISSQLDDYTQSPGWNGTSCYQAGGYIRVGAYGQNGTLQTPAINSQQFEPTAELTLLYTASSYPGKTVSYTLSLIDAENGQVASDTTMKADRNLVTHIFHFTDVPSQAAFCFKTNKERLFLDELSVAIGMRDSLDMRSLGPAVWSIDSIAPLLTEEGLQADRQQATVTGLVPQRTYHYQVTALDNEALRSSLPSHDIMVTTLPIGESGIEQIVIDKVRPTSSDHGLHDLLGRAIAHPTQGFYISDGRISIIRQ